MRERFSIEKAEWSDTREKQYRKDCLDIVFQFGDNIKKIDDKTYLIRNRELIEILKPDKQRSFWYETWLKLKDYYGV
ncbi:hypothetical protein [Paenibacillus xylanilyticus]|uniref:Uncharacterized protein n=1 Tax=Paenibacillus xylanilyticus TaxID=248903 RepID=A0A7Y6C1X4_9BACL|nr:hypothetical protein [Paenibacillus xylanilyticus]NUU78981.1 hypothetical protein [Paenibacillus xylanilyticus]